MYIYIPNTITLTEPNHSPPSFLPCVHPLCAYHYQLAKAAREPRFRPFRDNPPFEGKATQTTASCACVFPTAQLLIHHAAATLPPRDTNNSRAMTTL